MSGFFDDLSKLAGLVREKVDELGDRFTPKNPGTGTRVNRPARWTRDAGTGPHTQGTSSGGTAGTPLARLIALHRKGASSVPVALQDELSALQQRLVDVHELRATTVAAAGFLEALRGDFEQARSLLEIVDGFDRYNDRAAVVPAMQWLTADAATRGDWERVSALARGTSVAVDPQVRFFEALAAWHLRAPEVLLPGQLHELARSMPDPVAAEVWVQAATMPGGPTPASSSTDSTHQERLGLLTVTTQRHAALLRRPATTVTAANIAELCAQWDRCLASREVHRRLTERSAMLGASRSVEALLERIRSSVRLDLERIVLRGRLTMAAHADDGRTGLLGALVDGLEETLGADLELAVRALAVRRQAQGGAGELPLLDECRQWLVLRRQTEALARTCGLSGQLVAFHTLYSEVGAWACDLWNRRGARTLPNAMFRWIVQLADGVEDRRAAEVYRKNMEWGVA